MKYYQYIGTTEHDGIEDMLISEEELKGNKVEDYFLTTTTNIKKVGTLNITGNTHILTGCYKGW